MKLILNGQLTEVTEENLVGLLEQLGIDHQRNGIAVALNGDLLPRSRWAGQKLEENDEVEVITAMQGG
jgi:sulfur carrier protein